MKKILFIISALCLTLVLTIQPTKAWITVGNYDYSISDYYYIDTQDSSITTYNLGLLDGLYYGGVYNDNLKNNTYIIAFELYQKPLLIDVFRTLYINNSVYDVFDTDYQFLSFNVSVGSPQFFGGDNKTVYNEIGDEVLHINIHPIDTQTFNQIENTVYDISRFSNYGYLYFSFIITTDDTNVYTQDYVLNQLAKAFYLSNRQMENILLENYFGQDYNDGYNQGYDDAQDYFTNIVIPNEKNISYNQARQEYGYYDGVNWITANQRYNDGYDVGYDLGYDLGYNHGFNTSNDDLWPVIWGSITAPFALFEINIFPGVTFGMIAMIPLVFGLIAFLFSLGGKKK